METIANLTQSLNEAEWDKLGFVQVREMRAQLRRARTQCSFDHQGDDVVFYACGHGKTPISSLLRSAAVK